MSSIETAANPAPESAATMKETAPTTEIPATVSSGEFDVSLLPKFPSTSIPTDDEAEMSTLERALSDRVAELCLEDKKETPRAAPTDSPESVAISSSSPQSVTSGTPLPKRLDDVSSAPQPPPQYSQYQQPNHDHTKDDAILDKFHLTPEQVAELEVRRRDFVFFWQSTELFVGVFCQWFPSEFVDGAFTYTSCEQYMMAAKARLFQDFDSWVRIMMTSSPREIKALGRNVVGFDEQHWAALKFHIVFRANLCKFTQNPDLRQQLLQTGNRVLVEASPFDTVWGIGLSERDPRAVFPSLWQGSNLLGNALMLVRAFLNSTTTATHAGCFLCRDQCIAFVRQDNDPYCLRACKTCNHPSLSHVLVGAPLPDYPILNHHVSLCSTEGCVGAVAVPGVECELCRGGASMMLVNQVAQDHARLQFEQEQEDDDEWELTSVTPQPFAAMSAQAAAPQPTAMEGEVLVKKVEEVKTEE